MRKACMAGISVLIGISMLAGCGKSLDADTDTVYVQKNGTVLSVDVETLPVCFLGLRTSCLL